MKKYFIPFLIGFIPLFGYLGYEQFGAAPAREKITFDPATSQVVRWDKPTTDAEWAEDVKVESFDIKSTPKLTEMRDIHIAKLARVQESKKEVFECRECIDFRFRQQYSDATQAEIDANYADELSKANWEVEKLKQSIERMDKELELRDKGFVVVEGEERGLFGSIKTPYAIRTPHD